MPPDAIAVGYFIWGVDNAVYGPIELPTLVAWIKDERVVAETWVFVQRSENWEKAVRIPELQMFFHGHRADEVESAQESAPDFAGAGLVPGALRQVKVLACLSDEQLERLLQGVEIQTLGAGSQLVRQGDAANAMFILIEGELRVRALIEGHETSLGNLNPGEYFGEISLFDPGPRSADIFITKDCTVLKISAAAFVKLASERPDIAGGILQALTRTMALRLRADSKRYRDSFAFIRPPAR